MDDQIYKNYCGQQGHTYAVMATVSFSGIICVRCGHVHDKGFSEKARKRSINKLKRKT